MSDFSKKNSHEENIKVSIDKILGSNSILKRTKKTAEDHRKILFLQFIDNMFGLQIRDNELDRAFFLDLNKYNSPFYDTIDTILKIHFSEKQMNLIYFFLYDRITPEGYILDLEDAEGNILDISTPEKLYIEVLKIK